ncbi:MAG: dipicolinate synthase subunit B, partial [Clostridia bacterium]|nr:dipicolinate synthase subunit B [Clostridia bacterium]
MKPIVGFAVTGSFCTLHLSLKLMAALKERYDLVPIVSETVARTDTRFFTAAEYLEKVTAVCGRRPIASIVEAEPLGPNSPLDLLLICPCTGNTLAKLALGVTDTPVTMAAKAHLRGDRPLLIALATN